MIMGPESHLGREAAAKIMPTFSHQGSSWRWRILERLKVKPSNSRLFQLITPLANRTRNYG